MVPAVVVDSIPVAVREAVHMQDTVAAVGAAVAVVAGAAGSMEPVQEEPQGTQLEVLRGRVLQVGQTLNRQKLPYHLVGPSFPLMIEMT